MTKNIKRQDNWNTRLSRKRNKTSNWKQTCEAKAFQLYPAMNSSKMKINAINTVMTMITPPVMWSTEYPLSNAKVKQIYNIFCELINVSSKEPSFSLEASHCEDTHLTSNYVSNWIILLLLYIIALISLLIAVSIACDDYFVPSLDMISEKLKLSGAVAGATFMAAGSSAPEFFSSCIAVALRSDIGVGTITGSAVFNLLVIVACSALYVKKDLKLDWRPLARDSVFYTISVSVFLLASWDTLWSWWEALALVIIYIFYIVTMVFDEEVMECLTHMEKLFLKSKPSSIKPQLAKGVTFERVLSTRSDNPWSMSNQLMNRNRNISFMLHDDHLMKSSKPTVLTYSVRFSKIFSRQIHTDVSAAFGSQGSSDNSFQCESLESSNKAPRSRYCCRPNCSPPVLKKGQNRRSKCRNVFQYLAQWLVFLLGLPFLITFTFTIPDCTRPGYKKWYLVTFILSLVWIAAITYGMVKCIVEIGCLIKVNDYIMSIVFLAAGTSIPDMLSSVIVAKEGQGDMAISNALGSNVFDINIGIGLPFLVSIVLRRGSPESAFDKKDRKAYCQNRMKFYPQMQFGFILLLLVFISLAVIIWQKFRLTKKLGIVFMCLYLLFIAYAFFHQFWCTSRGYIC